MIDPLSRFGTLPAAFTDCTYADNPIRPGYECYHGTIPTFAGWLGSGGTTPYRSVINSLGLDNGFYW